LRDPENSAWARRGAVGGRSTGASCALALAGSKARLTRPCRAGAIPVRVETRRDVVHIARIANNSPDPLRFLTDLDDEIKAVVKGANISGMNQQSRQPHRAIQRRSTAFANEAAARRSTGVEVARCR
jgi:hypothetical protein